MGGWTIERVAALDGHGVEWVSEEELLVSRRQRLFRTREPGAPLTPVGEVPVPFWQATLGRLRPAQRLMRFFFYNVLELPDGSLFVSFGRQLGILREGRFQPVAAPREFRVLRGACALGDDGCLYLGEYLSNPGRGAVHVHRLPPGQSRLEVARRFEAGAARHVHGVYRDASDGSLWCLTGDRGAECRLLRTADGFRTVEELGGGDETWRCVSVLFTEKAIYYASDAEFQPNHVYRIDRATGRREVLGEIDGPVYYSHAVGSDLFFAVSAELCPSQQGRCATLWHVDGSDRLTRVHSFSKDALPVRYFLAGTLCFPRGPGRSGGTFVSAVGLRGADDRSFSLRPAVFT